MGYFTSSYSGAYTDDGVNWTMMPSACKILRSDGTDTGDYRAGLMSSPSAVAFGYPPDAPSTGRWVAVHDSGNERTGFYSDDGGTTWNYRGKLSNDSPDGTNDWTYSTDWKSIAYAETDEGGIYIAVGNKGSSYQARLDRGDDIAPVGYSYNGYEWFPAATNPPNNTSFTPRNQSWNYVQYENGLFTICAQGSLTTGNEASTSGKKRIAYSSTGLLWTGVEIDRDNVTGYGTANLYAGDWMSLASNPSGRMVAVSGEGNNIGGAYVYSMYSLTGGAGEAVLTLTDTTNVANLRLNDPVTQTSSGATGIISSINGTELKLLPYTGTWATSAPVTGPTFPPATGKIASLDSSANTMTFSETTGRWLVTEPGYDTAKKLNTKVLAPEVLNSGNAAQVALFNAINTSLTAYPTDRQVFVNALKAKIVGLSLTTTELKVLDEIAKSLSS
jgi:hypothetical protein